MWGCLGRGVGGTWKGMWEEIGKGSGGELNSGGEGCVKDDKDSTSMLYYLYFIGYA